MTSRQLRNQRRAAERNSRKLAQKTDAWPESLIQSPERSDRLEKDQAAAAAPSTRAEINRANSQHSSGPRTQQGKMKSSQNSFKHGLFSRQLVLPTEDPAEFDQLRASLRADHQPANTTEEILVNEIAENFWRLRRMRELEGRTMQPENFTDLVSLLPMIQRTMASAERGLYKSLATLRQLQKDRGFVPQESIEGVASSPEIGFVPQKASHAAPEIGFVSQKSTEAEPGLPFFQSPERSDGSSQAPANGFVSQNAPEPLVQAA
jgi:hypothetical protein